MSERRKEQRKYMTFFGRVFDRQSADLLGNIADITTDGTMVISSRPLDIGKVYQLRLDLPEYDFATDHLDLDALSVWCQPDIDPTFYNTGFQLLHATEEERLLIEKIIKLYQIRGDEQT